MGLGRQGFAEPNDRIHEARVEQRICPFDHEHADVLGREAELIDRITQAGRGSQKHVNAIQFNPIQLGLLLAVSLPNKSLELHVRTQGHENRLDLVSQLVGGGSNHGLDSVALHVKALQDRQAKGGRLARAIRSLSEDVTALDGGRDDALLQGRGLFEPVVE